MYDSFFLFGNLCLPIGLCFGRCILNVELDWLVGQIAADYLVLYWMSHFVIFLSYFTAPIIQVVVDSAMAPTQSANARISIGTLI